MNRFFQLVALILFITLAFTTYIILKPNNEALNIMTYNIRYASTQKDDSLHYWDKRKEHITDIIRFYNIDIVGVQEAVKIQCDFLENNLDNFGLIGVGRDDGKEKGEYSAILFSKTKFELLNSGTFWLSETPEKPSLGWDAAFNRVCTWAKFEDIKTGNQFFVFNTHFDHIGQKARLNSAKLILNKISELNYEKLPSILMGDFNVTKSNEVYKILNSSKSFINSKKISSHKHFGSSNTFNSWGNKDNQAEIDYIFVDRDAKVKEHAVINNTFDGEYASDHFPVMIKIDL